MCTDMNWFHKAADFVVMFAVWGGAWTVGPLPSGTLLRVEPHWGYWKSQHTKQTPGLNAGHDMNGEPLHILCVEYWVAGPCLSYTRVSVLGVGSRDRLSQYGIHREVCLGRSDGFILLNLDQLQFVKVTLQTVQTMAGMRGVPLSTFSTQHMSNMRQMYACRIDFFGWKDAVADERQGKAKFKEYTKGAPAALLPGSYELGSRCPIFSFDHRWNDTFDEHASFELLCYRYL